MPPLRTLQTFGVTVLTRADGGVAEQVFRETETLTKRVKNPDPGP